MVSERPAAAQDAIVRLQPAQLPQLASLLEASRLPSEDCPEQVDNFYGIFERERLIAAGGLQPAAEFFLLRSLVVAESCRGRGLGQALTEFLLARAEAAGSPAVYLLTETADDYFARLGFVAVARGQVPAAIAETRQFAELCPDTARCLVIGLPRG